MSTLEPATLNPDDSDPADGWERALLDSQLARLDRLADMGMDIAAEIHRRVKAADESTPVAELQHVPIDFGRVSRAVRLTFALQSRLIADFKGARPGKTAAAAADGPIEVCWVDDREENDEVQRRQVRGIVQRLAEDAALDAEAVERLAREAGERLENDNIHRDLTTRPLGEIVALICKDLGLEPDWDRLADAYWAKAEIARSATGSPYARWKARQAQEAPGQDARAPPLAGELSRSGP